MVFLRLFASTFLLSQVYSVACSAEYGEMQTKESVNVSCPRIVSRAEWGARSARQQQSLPYSPAPFVIVHHGGSPRYCYDQVNCSRVVRSYQDYHMDVRHWDDIGYNFVIGEDGNVYEGRGWNLTGAHAGMPYNKQSIGVCVIGDFTNRLPNEAALTALNSLISCGIGLGKVRNGYFVVGHRQVRQTDCPGEKFYDYVQHLPHWTDNPVPISGNQSAINVVKPA